MPTSRTSEQISADFDRIAQLPVRDRDHNTHYHKFLLAHLPQQMNSALDVGCGTGEFSRLLTGRTEHVIGIDLSPGMIEQAKSKSRGIPNVDFQVADVMVIDFAPDNFDAITSIATLHHLPLDRVLSRLATWVKPGGVLAILDLARVEPISLLLDGLSIVIHRIHQTLRPSEFTSTPEAQAAWHQHGKDETYVTASEVRRVCQEVLPGALVRRHLYWRYSLIWSKP